MYFWSTSHLGGLLSLDNHLSAHRYYLSHRWWLTAMLLKRGRLSHINAAHTVGSPEPIWLVFSLSSDWFSVDSMTLGSLV